MSEAGRVLRLRNPLFVPGGRPELLPKVARSAPDAVFVDLEDAVPPAEKETARKLVVEALTTTRLEVAVPEDRGDVAAARRIHGAGRFRELAALEHTEDEAADALLFGACALCAKFHS